MTQIIFDLAKLTKEQAGDVLSLAAEIHGAPHYTENTIKSELGSDSESSPTPPAPAPAPVALDPVPKIGEQVEDTTGGEEPEESEELDSQGIPWDGRIHSSNKKKTAKGEWYKRKGVDADEYNEILNELKQEAINAAAIQPPAAADPTPIMEQVPTLGASPMPASMPGQAQVPTDPAPVPAPVPAPAPAAAPATAPAATTGKTWPEIVKAIAAATNAGSYNAARFQEIAQEYGCENPGLLSNAMYAQHYDTIYNDPQLGIMGF